MSQPVHPADAIGDLSGANAVDGSRFLGDYNNAKTTVTTVGDWIFAVGLVGIPCAIVGMGVAAAVSGNKEPQYVKGAAIGAGAGIVGAMIL